MNPLDGMTPPATLPSAAEAAAWQTSAELDNCGKDVERIVRRLDRTPDGDPRLADLRRRLDRALDAYHRAERAAGAAADAYLEELA